ncbi:hypothetical protein RD055328_13940 [Companilactobacillus sp. RD055328]|uniref:hypothetical protein n=1 Tax=Companilactobacillus sp. RD055328 TaxID=2916634 RepID=UPI001FC7C209|nr:hypothetical protein [Companilactobacillus sp. RD055328]GKQ43471.1 hypothetical protein RD055328_13940 [Companilactobacillus sp. RD055328]
MFKKFSIISLSVMGIMLMAGCSNQSSNTDTKPKTETTTKKSSSNKEKDESNTSSTDDKTSAEDQSQKDNSSNDAVTNNNNVTNDNQTDTNTDNNTNNQQTNITTGTDAVTYLLGKLTNVDKTKVSALYNGTITDDAGKSTYRINLYNKGESSPFAAYNVYADGTYTQVW